MLPNRFGKLGTVNQVYSIATLHSRWAFETLHECWMCVKFSIVRKTMLYIGGYALALALIHSVSLLSLSPCATKCSYSYLLCISAAVMRNMWGYFFVRFAKKNTNTFGKPCRRFSMPTTFLPLEYGKYAHFLKEIYTRALRLNQNEQLVSMLLLILLILLGHHPVPVRHSITWVFHVRGNIYRWRV